jgi:hypothetical protein
MRLSRRLFWILFVAIAAAFVGGFTAAADEGSRSGTAGGDRIDMGFEQEANLTPQEQIAWADEKFTALENTRDYAIRLLSEARGEDRPDIIRINCLNNKLMEINAQILSFGDRRTSLGEAVRLGDNERRMHEYRVLVVVYQKVQSLRVELELCIGEGGIITTGGASVTPLLDPSVQNADLTGVDLPAPLMDRPPHGSGYY